MKKIRLANSKDLEVIINILNQVTKHLHENGIQQWSYPWSKRVIENDIANDYVYVIMANNIVIGTFSIKDTDEVEVDLITKHNKYLYRIAILPQFQGKGFGVDIINFALQFSGDLGESLFLDCWAGNTKLKSFYSSTGFVHLGDIPEESYMISVFKSK